MRNEKKNRKHTAQCSSISLYLLVIVLASKQKYTLIYNYLQIISDIHDKVSRLFHVCFNFFFISLFVGGILFLRWWQIIHLNYRFSRPNAKIISNLISWMKSHFAVSLIEKHSFFSLPLYFVSHMFEYLKSDAMQFYCHVWNVDKR